jgi:hypothetical protein
MSVVFSGYSVSSTYKTDNHDITDILLKVMLHTINSNLKIAKWILGFFLKRFIRFWTNSWSALLNVFWIFFARIKILPWIELLPYFKIGEYSSGPFVVLWKLQLMDCSLDLYWPWHLQIWRRRLHLLRCKDALPKRQRMPLKTTIWNWSNTI